MKTLCLPYCPGIPWNINDQEVIVRKLNGDPQALLTKDLNIVCHGGLLESFISTFAIEYLKYKHPYKKIIWHGSQEFKHVIDYQGIATYSNEITSEVANSYPIHFFKDKENNTYFNLLDNYLDYHTYLGKKIKKNKMNFIDTFNKNFMLENLMKHKLQCRNKPEDLEFISWCNLNKNILNKPYVVILPDRLTTSMHHLDFMNFSMMELRGLTSVLNSKGIQVIIMSNDPSKYYGNFKFIKYSFARFLSLAVNSKIVLSRQPDFSLIALMISRANVYSYMIRHMPKIKLKPSIRRIKGRIDPDWKYLKRQNTIPLLIEDITRRIYER
jgi:hypothetical protein